MSTVRNPVIRGFAPDPTVIQVEGWFYLATSSFEWFPTIPLYRSADLADWQYIGSVETAVPSRQLYGVPDSAGIWAPSLSHDGEKFWVTYSIVRTFLGRQLDVETYIATATDPAGPWSEPTRVSGHGFDPALFHHDGRHFLLNVQSDSRPGGSRFSGIILVPLNEAGTAAEGEPRLLVQHPTLIEGPKLFCHDGWFYLVLAQGGTGVEHGVLMARSRDILGPYEMAPGPLLTSRDDRSLRLQKAGHAEFVHVPDGRWYISHLASRWLDTLQGRQYPWGRETCLQEIHWHDGWPVLAQGGHHPAEDFAGVAATGTAAKPQSDVDRPWHSLREPPGDWVDFESAADTVALRGRHGLESTFGVSLLAKPLQSPYSRLETTIDAQPTTYTQGAGVVLWYNSSSYYSLEITWAEPDGETQAGQQWQNRGHRLAVLTARDQSGARVLCSIPLDAEAVNVGATVDGAEARFDINGRTVGPTLDVGVLSDDYGGVLRFTGSFAGIYTVDTVDAAFTARFTAPSLLRLGG